MSTSENKRQLDHIDRQILALLQADGRMTTTELARAVNLTVTPCIDRVRRLERDGFIEGYFAKLNAPLLGQTLLAFTEVTLDHATTDVFERFKAAVMSVEQIVECHIVAGGFDYLLKTRVSDLEEYRKVLGDKIAAVRGVRHTQTYFVMEVVKSTHSVRIETPARGASGRSKKRIR